ncbi:hypothetical protein HJFPF1_00503 [Paramyrothecium foliicola]|nr:hypothetical protein HJFPF1_00503 [Paramyrothecium foliicola]
MPTRVNSYSSTTSTSSASSGSSSASSAASSGTSTPTGPAAQPTFGDNRGIRFEIRTGTNRWTCTLQDRSVYERTKATRTNSTDSVISDVASP